MGDTPTAAPVRAHVRQGRSLASRLERSAARKGRSLARKLEHARAAAKMARARLELAEQAAHEWALEAFTDCPCSRCGGET